MGLFSFNIIILNGVISFIIIRIFKLGFYGYYKLENGFLNIAFYNLYNMFLNGYFC